MTVHSPQYQGRAERMRHLALANEARAARVHIKHALRDGTLSLPAALRDPDSARMRIGELLAAQRGWGDATVHKTLHQRHISPSRRVSKLTDREIDELSRTAAGEAYPRWRA